MESASLHSTFGHHKTTSLRITMPVAPDRSTSAASSVFAVNELLEMVLLLLPFKDILLSQAVCRQWKENIESSKKLQQSLSLRPIEARWAWLYDGTHNNGLDDTSRPAQGNPRRKPMSGFFRKVAPDFTLSPAQVENGLFSVRMSGHLHPLCKLRHRYSTFRSTKPEVEICTLRRALPSSEHAEPSWGQMLWCQPPLEILKMFWLRAASSSGKSAYLGTLVGDGYIDDKNCTTRERTFPGAEEAYGGPFTIGEIVSLMDKYSGSAGDPANDGYARVYTAEMYFPTKEEHSKGVVWESYDDWYYRPLAEKGVLFGNEDEQGKVDGS